MIVQIARGMLTNRNPQHSFNNQYKTLLHYYCADCMRDADQQESATQFQQPIQNTLIYYCADCLRDADLQPIGILNTVSTANKKHSLYYYCADCLRDTDQQESSTQFQQPKKTLLHYYCADCRGDDEESSRTSLQLATCLAAVGGHRLHRGRLLCRLCIGRAAAVEHASRTRGAQQGEEGERYGEG